jgi:septal ring factor EnvC (AmiA/AmiB activator)
MCSGRRAGARVLHRTGRAVLLLLSVRASGSVAQQPPPDTALQRSQERLAEIRRERERLEREMERLRGRVYSLSSELSNIERQVQISGRIVSELDLQVAAMGSQIERTTADLVIAEDALAEKRAILQHRLAEIAKRGPLYTAQVLLRAESFGDLISRYKYLYLISRQDRQLVREVQALRDRVREQRDGLLSLRSTLARRRDERAEETERLRTLERQREQSLQESRRQQRVFERRLAQLARDEARLTNLIRELERRRRAAEAASRRPPAPGRLRTADLGRLAWPVEGEILYNFGRAPGPGNTTIRWNGIGIAAPVGTPVRSIAGGTVRYAQQLGTYGLSVLVDHGGGYYSLYAHLETASVRAGQAVEPGQLIATTGGANSDQGPHLHFEIRGADGQAQDPIQWLRQRR